MSSTGSLTTKILAGSNFSDIITLPWESNIGIAYIATTDDVASGTKMELWMQSKKDPAVWLPFFNPSKNANAAIDLVKDKIIPCSPYTDGRGARAVKFKLSQTQANDITLEIGLVKLLYS